MGNDSKNHSGINQRPVLRSAALTVISSSGAQAVITACQFQQALDGKFSTAASADWV